MSFVAELKRRNVVRVAVAYLAGAWLLIQIADTVVPAFGWAEKSVGIFITVLVIGFIPSLVVAWVFELTPDGLKRDEEVVAGKTIAPTTARMLDRVIMVALALAVAYFAVDKFVFPATVPTAANYDKSIAVLPFEDMSIEGDQTYFSDGIAEEILNVLAQVKDLRVVSRSSSFTYRGPVVISEVADALNVSYVLEGSVRKAGDEIRVTAQLIDTRDDSHAWSKTFDRELTDIFDIQDDIAKSVAEHLEAAITNRHREPQKTDPETYAMFLRARHKYYGQSGNFTEFEEEIGLLRRALERDPSYVPAMTLLAVVLQHVPSEDRAQREAKVQERMQLIRDAYAIDPDDAVANMFMGWNVMIETGDKQQGIRYIERSLKLEPSNVEVLRTAAFVASDVGRTDDAVMLLRQALIREPLCIPCYANLSRILVQDHRWVEAEKILRRRLAIDEQDIGAHINLALVFIETGRAEEAIDIIDKWEPDEDFRLGFRSMALDELGRSDEAEQAISQLQEKFGDKPFVLASFYGKRADVEQTLHWLGVVLDQDPGAWTYLVFDRLYDFLHTTPQWQQWLSDFGYAQQDLDKIEFEIPDFGES